MKKLLFILSAATICFFTACNEKAATHGGLSDAARKNLDAFHAVDTAFQTGDLSRIDSVVASDFVDHTPKGDMGRDSLKAMITMMKNAGTMKSEIKKEFADDEYVMAWMRWTGTSDGSLPDMPAGPYDMSGIEVVRFKDGKAVEHWAFMDARELMKMMGGGQQMPTPSPTSTDKAK
ncbi:MAG TPA: ester cyclase [Chitinophagaceae bacterium]|nr:ester cyclase [Chitinophagaceae bacterium]